MSHRMATSRLATLATAAVAVVAGSLVLAASASATTFNVTDTTSFVNAVASSNGSAGTNDTINMAGGVYLPGATVNFTKTTGTVTVVGTTARPQVKIDGGAVQPFPSPIVTIAKNANVTFQGVLFTTGGGPGTPALDVFGTLDLENAQVSGNNGTGVLLEPNSPAAMIRNSNLDSGLDFGLVNQSKATLINDTVYLNSNGGIDNTVGQTTLVNTIVAKNGGSSPTDCFNHPAVSSDHSLDSDGSCVSTGSGNLKATDPKLGKLTDDLGPTSSFPVQPGSPVIDAGNSAQCPANDVRFIPRPDVASTACDMGADEYNATPPTFSNVPANITTPGTSAAGATATYTKPTAASTDDAVVGGNTNGVSCSPASGSTFPYGTTTVTCSAKDFHGATGTATFTVTVTDAPLTASNAPALNNGVEGFTLLSPPVATSGVVATFTDADTAGTVSEFSATIDWGDGSTSPGTIAASGAGFIVNGSHQYGEGGSYPIKVAIKDVGGQTAAATSSAVVAEPSNAVAALLDEPVDPLPIVGPIF